MKRAIAAALAVFMATQAHGQAGIMSIPVPCWSEKSDVLDWLGERAELVQLGDPNQNGVAAFYAEGVDVVAMLVKFPDGPYCSMWSAKVITS